jgi:hypothetical protein
MRYDEDMVGLEALRGPSVMSEDLAPLLDDLRAQGFEVQEGHLIEKGIDEVIKNSLMFVVYLVADETAREFIRFGLGRIIDYFIGFAQKKGPTRVSFHFRTPDEGPELWFTMETHEPKAIKTMEKIVGHMAEYGTVTALKKLPPGEYQAMIYLPVAHSPHYRAKGTGEFIVFDFATGQWKPIEKRPKKAK